MKKLILLGVFFMLVLFSFVLADLTVTDVNLGGDNQERTFDDDEPVYADEKNFTITNNGNSTVTGINISSNAASEYNVTFSGFTAGFNLTNGSSKTITVEAIVPEDFDAVDDEGREEAMDIGDIIVTSSASNATADLFMQAENMLIIDEVTIEWDDKDEEVDDGDSIDEVKPGDTITMTIVVENLYDDSGNYDFDIEDIEIQLESSDDDEVDFDDDNKDIGDIDGEEDTEETFNIEVEEDAEGDYTITIMVTGEDENEALHGAYMEFEIEVEREDEDIRIMTAELIPESVSCDRNIRLETEIENIGDDNSEEIVLLIESDDFDYRERIVNIDLDTEDDYDKTFTINVPEDAEEGIYLFSVKTFFDSDDYNYDDYNDVIDVMLTVRDCEVTPPADEEDEEEEEEDGDIIVQPPTTPPTGGVVYGQPVSAVEDFFDTPAYLALLAVGGLIGIALLFLAIAIIVRR